MAQKEKESKGIDRSSQAYRDLKNKFSDDLKESKGFMDPIQQRMDKDYEIYRNYRYVDDCEFKISDFYAYVETVVPIVTNNRIRANVSSDYPDYIVHAKGLNDILDNTYDINNWDYMSQELFRMAMIYRSAFAYTGYDSKYKNDTGKLCIDVVNPRWCWTDPAACHLDKDSRFFFYVEPMRKSQVLKMHPEIKSELNLSSASMGPWTTSNQGTGSTWFKTWLRSVKSFLNFNNTGTQAKQVETYTVLPELDEQDKYKNVIAYIHYWYRDEDTDEWRVSHWADDILCDDMANPFYHGCLPYDILSPIKDPLSAWGIPVNEQMEEMNVQRNLLMQYYINNAQLHGNPPLLYNTTMGNVRDPEKLKEQAMGTGVIPINNPDMVPLQAIADYMNVPVMPGSATSLFDHLGAIMDNISGINDSFRGTAQASSGKEVQLQQEAAYTRIKTMIDQFELFNKRIAEKIISNAMQFYTQNRGFRIKGDYRKYENIQKMQEMNGEEMPFEVKGVQQGVNEETGEPVMNKTEFFIYANPSEWTKLKPDMESGIDGEEEQELEGYDSDDQEADADTATKSRDKREKSNEEKEVEKAIKILQMTVEIEAGSSLPQSRIARREEASELFQAGAIDQEALLDAYDYPDRDKIMKRMAEAAQRQQEAQAQAAQAEAEAKLQAEQAKIQAQMQMEQVKIQAEMQKNEMNNAAKLEQQQLSNQGQIAEQGMQNSGNSLEDILQKVRQAAPQVQGMSDDEILQLITQG